jgi:hypothetical protein
MMISTASSFSTGLENARELHTLSNRCQETVPCSMQMQSRGRILLGDLLQPNGALRMPVKSHVLTSHGLSGKPLDHQTSITSVTASVCGERLQLLDQNVPRYSIIGASNFDGSDSHLPGAGIHSNEPGRS